MNTHHATSVHAAPSLWSWFTGDGRYMDLIHCMGQDTLWIAITVFLDLAVACGYLLIARHWQKNQQTLPAGPAKKALGQLRNIFLFCGLCGYLFIPIKMFWPAWRLYDVAMAFLLYYTWRYALNARGLKVIYRELNRSEQLAADLQASREESRRKSFFLNAVSHDLRTPLNSMMLQADLAQIHVDANDPQALRETLNEIKASAAATAALLNNFLELGRLDWSVDENRAETVDVNALLRQVASAHGAAAEQKGLYLRVKQDESFAAVRTDRMKLERILTNLVNNAVKFTDAGGVTIGADRAGADLILRVTDTGVGIAPEHQESLFEEFYQVRNDERDRRKGFGLGLAIARRLARQLGGGIRVDSAPGRGATFEFRLPGALVAGGGGTPAGDVRSDADAAPVAAR